MSAQIKKKNIRTDENTGINDEKGFIQLFRLSSGYKGIGKFLKAILLFKYGFATIPSLEMLEEVR